jgi:hypothetical protein
LAPPTFQADSTANAEEAVMNQLAGHEITDLVHRLGAALDEGRFDDLGALVVDDATVRTPGGTAVGRAALVAQAGRNHDPAEGIQHVITNVLVDLDGDRARVRANLVVHFAPPAPAGGAVPAPPVQYTLGEVYRFEVVRTGSGWRFASIATEPVWASGSPPAR